MSSFGKMFGMNEQVEKEGIWIGYGPNDKGNPIEIRIARAGGSNKVFASRHEVLTRPHRRLIQADMMDKTVMEGLMQRLYAETVVKDWRGVLDDNGTEIPFNAEAVIEQFKLYPDLFSDVVDQSTKAALFRDDVREADAKN